MSNSLEKLKEVFKKLEEQEEKNYENIMKGDFLPVNPLILNNEEEIIWNFEKEKLLQKDCPSKYLIEITVNTQSRDSHFSNVIAYTILKKDFMAGFYGKEITRRMWIADGIKDQLNFKVDISSIEVGKQSKLWKEKENE